MQGIFISAGHLDYLVT